MQQRMLKAVVKMYLSAQEAAKKQSEENGMSLEFTPAHLLRIFVLYKRLLKDRGIVVK